MVFFKSLFNSRLIDIIIFEIHEIFLNFLNILFIYECEVSEIKTSEVIFNFIFYNGMNLRYFLRF